MPHAFRVPGEKTSDIEEENRDVMREMSPAEIKKDQPPLNKSEGQSSQTEDDELGQDKDKAQFQKEGSMEKAMIMDNGRTGQEDRLDEEGASGDGQSHQQESESPLSDRGSQESQPLSGLAAARAIRAEKKMRKKIADQKRCRNLQIVHHHTSSLSEDHGLKINCDEEKRIKESG